MTDVDEYIDAINDPNLRRLASKVRRIARKAPPQALESMKWGVPNCSIDGENIASITSHSKHINLYFFQGAKLSSTLLQGTGKRMRHIKIRESRDIRQTEFIGLLRKATKITSAV
jgi:hypothetical protein